MIAALLLSSLTINNAKAVTSPNATQVGLVVGPILAYIYHLHEVDQAQKDKGLATKALDAAHQTSTGIINNKYVKALGLASGLVVLAHYSPQIIESLKAVGSTALGAAKS